MSELGNQPQQEFNRPQQELPHFNEINTIDTQPDMPELPYDFAYTTGMSRNLTQENAERVSEFTRYIDGLIGTPGANISILLGDPISFQSDSPIMVKAQYRCMEGPHYIPLNSVVPYDPFGNALCPEHGTLLFIEIARVDNHT